MKALKADIISQLRKEILAMSGVQPALAEEVVNEELPFMQAHFPFAVFPRAAVHELICSAQEDIAASSGFVASLLSSLFTTAAPMIWISEQRQVFPSGLVPFNIDPSQIIFIQPANAKETLWVTEEALKCKGISAVVAEMSGIEFLHSRRFQLAVEKSLVTAFIINHKKGDAANNACISRWKITTAKSYVQDGLPGVGNPVWDVQLEKIRNGKIGNWLLQWDGDTIKEVKTKEAIIASTMLRKKTG